jgi:hypothetical protein
MKNWIWVLVVLSFTCKKYEVNTVPGNNPPSDPTISNEIKNNYINRLYIKLLDRKADSIEHQTALNLLNEAPSSQAKRKEVIELIKNDPAYYHVLWKEIRELLLDGSDTSDINETYTELKEDWQNASGNAKDQLEYEWKRMEKLLNADQKLASGEYNWESLQKLSCYNYIYEDLNMGSENYVVAVFQNLIFRYPTIQELDAGKDMYNGNPAVLFLQAGQTQQEFLDIFFSSRSYFEGQVLYLFKNEIFRDPTSQEQDYYTNYYLNAGDFESLYFEVLSSEIYFNQ